MGFSNLLMKKWKNHHNSKDMDMTKDLFDLELELNECFNRISKDFNQIINLVKEELIQTVKIAVKESQNQNQFMNYDLNLNRNRRKHKHQNFENVPGAKVIRTEILGTKSVINEIYNENVGCPLKF